MLKKLVIVLFIVLLASGVFWVGLSIYGNFLSGGNDSVNIPSEATHKAVLEDAGEVIYIISPEYIDDYIIAHGYWELFKGKYIYRDKELMLDEATVGNVRIEALQ